MVGRGEGCRRLGLWFYWSPMTLSLVLRVLLLGCVLCSFPVGGFAQTHSCGYQKSQDYGEHRLLRIGR